MSSSQTRRASQGSAPDRFAFRLRRRSIALWQREHRELAAERGVVRQSGIAADRTEACLRIGETRGKADTRPTADARENGDVLPAALLIGHHVSDDAGRGLELVELLARLGIDSLQVAFQRSVEDNAAGRRESSRPHRELILVRQDDLVLAG